MTFNKESFSKYAFPIVAIVSIGLVLATSLGGFSTDKTDNNGTEEVETIGESYYTYTPEQLAESREESEVILLNFYATWCASCNEFEPTIKDVMEEVGQSRNIVGYRVNFGDTAETNYGKDLAKEYGVTTQTTTLILNKHGEIFKTYFTAVSEEELESALLAAALSNDIVSGTVAR